MVRFFRSIVVTTTVVATAALGMPGAAAAGDPVVIHQGRVIRQDIASQGTSEPDTVVEPDIAVSPKNRNIAIAAAHDSRYSDGGAVGISAAWTADGGATWHHKPVQGLTTASGGLYERASDPVVAFGPDGSAYLSVLVLNITGCATAVKVARSTNGGRTWMRPVTVHGSASCNYSDDKNWIVVDNSPRSPHYGRIYQFWTPFISTDTAFIGSPQVVRWSDDKGRTWSNTSNVTPQDRGTQNSQPMILPNGTIVDTFYDFGSGQRTPDLVPGGAPESPRLQRAHRSALAANATIDAEGTVYASRSTDGGATWSTETEVVNNAGGYSDGVRCCLFSANIDPITHRMYVAYEGGVGSTDPVYIVFSKGGVQWSSPIRVSRGDVDGVSRVNVDVVARNGVVYVAYGTRTQPHHSGGFVQQQLSVSRSRGTRFGAPISIGPRSELKYAAQARGYFPGDYIGQALAPGRLYMVWARSSKPPAGSKSKYHQVIFGATLRV